jgi:hypothetical protein
MVQLSPLFCHVQCEIQVEVLGQMILCVLALTQKACKKHQLYNQNVCSASFELQSSGELKNKKCSPKNSSKLCHFQMHNFGDHSFCVT